MTVIGMSRINSPSTPLKKASGRKANTVVNVPAKLAAPTGFALPTIQRHLEVLEEAGLITTQKQGRTRICTARPQPMAEVADWLTETRAKMQSQTDRLGQYLDSLFKDIA